MQPDYSKSFADLSSIYGFGGGHLPNPHSSLEGASSTPGSSSPNSSPSRLRRSLNIFRKKSKRSHSPPPPPPPTPWDSLTSLQTINSASTSPTMYSYDYDTAFGNLASTYGFGGVVSVPSTPTLNDKGAEKTRYFWRSRRSSCRSDDESCNRLSKVESTLGGLLNEYGLGTPGSVGPGSRY